MESEEELEPQSAAAPAARPSSPPVGIPRTRVNLDEELWSNCGEVHDIPHIKDFPESMRNILYKYRDVFKNSLSKARKRRTEPVHLELDPDIPILAPATKCRAVPIHWQDNYDELLDTLIAKGIIVKQEGATKFVAPSFIVAKPHDPSHGRMVQDFGQGMNKCLRRCTTPIPAPWQVWQRVSADSTCFFSADLSASYYQIPIDEESQPLTCFMTPRGRFHMTWLSMGLSASSDAFNHRIGTIMDNFPNLRLAREIDDLLIHAVDMAQLDKQLELLLSIYSHFLASLHSSRRGPRTQPPQPVICGSYCRQKPPMFGQKTTRGNLWSSRRSCALPSFFSHTTPASRPLSVQTRVT